MAGLIGQGTQMMGGTFLEHDEGLGRQHLQRLRVPLPAVVGAVHVGLAMVWV